MSEEQLARVEASIIELRERMGRVEGRLEELSKRIDDINHSLSNRIDDLHKRIDDVNHSLSNRIDDLHKTVTAWFTVITILMIFLTAILPLVFRYLRIYS